MVEITATLESLFDRN